LFSKCDYSTKETTIPWVEHLAISQRKEIRAKSCWFRLVILAIWEAEIRRIVVPGF
jgi:hypothetical protein